MKTNQINPLAAAINNDEVSSAAAVLGRKGGSAKTSAKKAASRANGANGGRPPAQVRGGSTLSPSGQELDECRALCRELTKRERSNAPASVLALEGGFGGRKIYFTQEDENTTGGFYFLA